MKRLLLATAAAISLSLGAASAQDLTQPVPTPPPIQTPAETTDNLEGEVGTLAETPQSDTSVATEAQTEIEPSAQAAANAEAMAASPATPATAATPATPTPASATTVCQPRVTSVHFGRSSALSQQNRNAIEHAVDAASVCSLQQVVIADTGQGSRRAETVRAALVRQGVPNELIRVDASAAPAEGAATGQLDVRMQFAGIANTDVAAATAAQAPVATPAQLDPVIAEEPTNEAEEAPGS